MSADGTSTLTAPLAPAGSNVVLEARNIVKELGHGARKTRALKGVSLTLNAGELTLLMGPSGSGKTTLLSILGCILTPTEGTLTIASHPTAGFSPEELAGLRRRHVGFIFQSYNLFPTLTAEENVRIALDVRGERGSDAVVRAQRALQQVGRCSGRPRGRSIGLGGYGLGTASQRFCAPASGAFWCSGGTSKRSTTVTAH